MVVHYSVDSAISRYVVAIILMVEYPVSLCIHDRAFRVSLLLRIPPDFLSLVWVVPEFLSTLRIRKSLLCSGSH